MLSAITGRIKLNICFKNGSKFFVQSIALILGGKIKENFPLLSFGHLGMYLHIAQAIPPAS